MIDKELLNTRKILGKEFFQTILVKFEADAGEMITLLSDLTKAEQWSQLGDAAHRLKGIAANVGAKTMADVSYQLQKAGESGQVEEVPQLLAQLPQLFEQSLIELREYTETF